MNKTFDVSGPVRVNVELASGTIEVDPTADNATVELIAHDESSQELVDAATVELRGNELVVDVPNRRTGFNLGNFFGGRGISCTIRVPHGSSLRTRSKSADVVVRGPVAEADIATASGDARLADVTGDLTFKGASGDLAARTVGGRANVATASGDIELGVVGGPVSANTASGDILVAGAHSDARANTASGDIELDAVVSGEVTVNSASGDVRIGISRGTRAYFDCQTVSGDTSSELDVTGEEPNGNGPLVHVKARTVSGDIRITRASALADNAEEVQA
jgi:DUF4097 and DUF4098 domain-containing protein YvlB